MLRRFLGLIGLACLCAPAHADIESDAALFGALPSFSDVAISPNGEVVVLMKDNGTDVAIYARNIVTNENIMAQSAPMAYELDATFVDDRYLLVDRRFYRTARTVTGLRVVPYMETLIFDLEKKKSYGFLEKNRTVHAHPFTPRRIVGPGPKKGHVYARAYGSGPSGGFTSNLYDVDLASGRGKLALRGDADLNADFLPLPDGQSVLRENHGLEKRIYQLDVLKGDDSHRMFESTLTGFRTLAPTGFDGDGAKLYFRASAGKDLENVVVSAPTDDHFDFLVRTPSIEFHKDDSDVEHIFVDFNNVVHGARYSGFRPSYEFLNDEVDAALAMLQDQFPDDSISVRSWSKDFAKVVILIEGGSQSGKFYLLDVASHQMLLLARKYADIPDERIGRIEAFRYAARDGLEIPAILTHPVKAPANGKAPPLVVLPHGGPAAHDSLEFDYWAQFLANQGYIVLQPNFRGSNGFGRRFQDAGAGEWGRKMQDDITDGVKALIDGGQADGDRVCIMGGSYGGYAALAGGAFTPELYKCVIALAPVADLEKFLAYEREYGPRSNNFSLAYWESVIGSHRQRDELFAASPARNADRFQAPVLLVHGAFDWVVPPDQSGYMETALKAAGKDVTAYTLKGGDHFLSQAVHRSDFLKLVGEFLDTHIGAGEPAAETPAP